MTFYTILSMKYFGWLSDVISPYFTDVKHDLKRSQMRMSLKEYTSIAIFTSILVFIVELPLLSFIISILIPSPFFSFVTALTISVALPIIFFFLFMNYPKVIIKERAKEIDGNLTFASIYMSTLSSSRLPMYKVFDIFSKSSKYGQITNEISNIKKDMDVFGIDINTALERAVERTPSKTFKEMLWSMLSLSRTGGDVNIYLKEKAKNFIGEYRRRLFEFSHQLTIFVEIYLTAIVLGVIFFTVLTSIIGGISAIGPVSGSGGNVIILQFILICVFLPGLSAIFIVLIKSSMPPGE